MVPYGFNTNGLSDFWKKNTKEKTHDPHNTTLLTILNRSD